MDTHKHGNHCGFVMSAPHLFHILCIHTISFCFCYTEMQQNVGTFPPLGEVQTTLIYFLTN